MALTGFDPSKVNNSIKSVLSAYTELMRVLGDDMQSKFVGGMSDKWACKNAQTFFNDAFKPTMQDLMTNSTTTFSSVVDSMNSAARGWASETGATYLPIPMAIIVKNIDTSVILENIGGVRGIDFAEANNVTSSSLSQIASSAKDALTQAQQAVRDCGFIGGSQENNLVNSLGQIKDKIDSTIQTITTDVTTAIRNTVESYTDTEGRISQAFTVQ